MTFEQRQRAEEEIAGFIHQHTTEEDRPRYKALDTMEKLALLMGMASLMFDEAMHDRDDAEAREIGQDMVRIRNLALKQRWMDTHPA